MNIMRVELYLYGCVGPYFYARRDFNANDFEINFLLGKGIEFFL